MNSAHLTKLLALFAVLALAVTALAGVPTTLNYQGYLKDSAGVPVNTATSIRFSLYSSNPARSNPVWAETKSVTPANGIYSTQLGSVTPITATFDVPYWLGVKVEGDAEMALQAFSSVPYAKRAAVADSVVSGSIGTSSISDNSVTTAKIAAGAVTDAKISGTISAAKLDLSNRVAKAGDTMTGDLTMSGASINLPATTASAGMIRQGGNRLLHTYGSQNFFAGTNAGNLSTSGTGSNTGVGTNALAAVSTGFANTATGNGALTSNTGGTWNTATGNGALGANTSGTENTATGGTALGLNTTGNYNTAHGGGALSNNTTGNYNTASGRYALQNNTTAGNNTALGNLALNRQSFSNGGIPWDSWNTAVGANSLYFNQPDSTGSGVYNSGLGAQALYNNSTGSYNTASGYMALYANTTGNANTASGYGALDSNTTGNANTASGYQALQANTTGYNNTASGYYALYSNTTGYYNTALGYQADVISGALNNATAIGYNAKVSANNSLVLGGTGTDAVKVGIGTQAPAATLTVVNSAAASKGLTVQGTVSQSANLQEWQDSAGAAMFSVNSTGNIRNYNKDIYLRDGSDINHGLGWYGATKLFASSNIDGPVLYGWSGGALGTTNGGQKIALAWDSNGKVGVGKTAGSDQLDVNGTLRINDNDAFLRSSGDTAHGMGFYGGTKLFGTNNPDGPVLYGSSGGILGTTGWGMGKQAVLTWNYNGSVGVGLAPNTTPGAKLEVAGNLKVSGSGNGMIFPDGTTQTTAAAPSWYQAPPVQLPRTTTLTSVDSTGNVGAYSSITIGTDGLPVVSYYDVTNTDLKVTKCGNTACSSGNTITTVDSAGDVGTYSSITIGTDGLPVISYYDFTNSDLKVAKCANAACTGSATITTIDSTGNVGQYTSITIGTDGLPVISYLDSTNGDLKVAKCANAACTGAAIITTVDNSAGVVGSQTSIAIGTDGLPVISYEDFTNGDLKVAKCANAACTGSATITTIDSTGNVGQSTSITIGTDGLPVISYEDFTNGDLKVAKCGNVPCTSGNTITTVDNGGTGRVGQYTSIAIGSDGLPVISHFDLTNGDLKVAKCANAACTGTATLTTVDSTGVVGYYTSITIGTDGLPVLSYYDQNNSALKVAKCANQFCLNNWSRR